jgi:hypothetical protein
MGSVGAGTLAFAVHSRCSSVSPPAEGVVTAASLLTSDESNPRGENMGSCPPATAPKCQPPIPHTPAPQPPEEEAGASAPASAPPALPPPKRQWRLGAGDPRSAAPALR